MVGLGHLGEEGRVVAEAHAVRVEQPQARLFVRVLGSRVQEGEEGRTLRAIQPEKKNIIICGLDNHGCALDRCNIPSNGSASKQTVSP